MIIRFRVVLVIQLTPLQSFHLWIIIMEDILYPSYDIIEIQLHFIDVRVKSMLLHILLDMSTAHPIKSCLQEILADNRPRDIPSPFLNTCICLITELLASSTDKRPRIDSVQLFLLIPFPCLFFICRRFPQQERSFPFPDDSYIYRYRFASCTFHLES